MTLSAQAQRIAEATPKWLDALVIGGSAAASWITPIAGIVAIVWGGMQCYTWIVNKQWRRRGK